MAIGNPRWFSARSLLPVYHCDRGQLRSWLLALPGGNCIHCWCCPVWTSPPAVGHPLLMAPGPAPLLVPQLCCPGWARGCLQSQSTGLCTAQAAGTERVPAWAHGYTEHGAVSVWGAALLPRGPTAGAISMCLLDHTVPEARPSSPAPGYRQLSRQHTPTHHKHLA